MVVVEAAVVEGAGAVVVVVVVVVVLLRGARGVRLEEAGLEQAASRRPATSADPRGPTERSHLPRTGRKPTHRGTAGNGDIDAALALRTLANAVSQQGADSWGRKERCSM